MESYPQEYVEHNLPLVVVSGLGEAPTTVGSTTYAQEYGTRLHISALACAGEQAKTLLQQFLQLDGSELPWNWVSLPGPTGTLKYKIKPTGRTYVLPPRKAAPLPQAPSMEGASQSGVQSRHELHSPLSPQSPGSPIFPDGLFTPAWLRKHQSQVPAAFIACFNISAADSSADDERLKNDINALRSAISRSGYKTRLAVVLISDKSILNAPQLEERLSSIRRLTSLDGKTGLFFMPPMSSQGEIATFVHGTMTTLQPLCVEYYRDLTKHARRKKTRIVNTSSSQSALSGSNAHSLSSAGWSVRYETKLGIFAELRQEMEIAERHYSTAIDEMCADGGLFATLPSTSPRWDSARLLCDCLALRLLRCLLWNSQTTGAARFFTGYKSRMTNLLSRYGKGTNTYSFAAWEARWAEIMAQLIQRARLETLQVPSTAESGDVVQSDNPRLFALPEKLFAVAERMNAFHYLHHSGYWLRLAYQGCRRRRNLALQIPPEDRTPPDQSPASALVAKNNDADLYLVPDPYREAQLVHNSTDQDSHTRRCVDMGQQATAQFEARAQTRMSDAVKLEMAQMLLTSGNHREALEILKPLWQTTRWRNEAWHDAFEHLLIALCECARKLDEHELLLAATYELMSVPADVQGGRPPSLENCLAGLSQKDELITLTSIGDERRCPFALTFVFSEGETYVGQVSECQLELVSLCHTSTLTLTDVTVRMVSAKTTVDICIEHDDSAEQVALVELHPVNTGPTNAVANLTFPPGSRHALDFSTTFRLPGTYRVEQIAIHLRSQVFSIEHKLDAGFIRKSTRLLKKPARSEIREFPATHLDTLALTVLPKPPKVGLAISGHRKEYYADEIVRFEVLLTNAEAETVNGTVSAEAKCLEEEPVLLQWLDTAGGDSDELPTREMSGKIITKDIGSLPSSQSSKIVLLVRLPALPVEAEVHFSLEYMLESDSSNTLQVRKLVELISIDPFEARFNFGPLFCEEEWPSYFDSQPGGNERRPIGLPQMWRLGSVFRSRASDSLLLHDIRPVVVEVAGESSAALHDLADMEALTLAPNQTERMLFEIATQKWSLDDRGPTTLHCSVAVTWSRNGNSAPQVVTILPVPLLTLPVSEPKVLCTVTKGYDQDEYDAVLHYHIENPSTHFLTFAITMEATEDFAFSGPKYRTLSLAPLSRYDAAYPVILQDIAESTSKAPPDAEGRWIWPALQVVDSYYEKNLRVHPGGSGVRTDDQQNIGVLVHSL